MKPIVSEKILITPSEVTYVHRFQYRISFQVKEGPESLEYLQKRFQPFEPEIKAFFQKYFKPYYCNMQEYFSQKKDEKCYVIQVEVLGGKSVFNALQKLAESWEY